MKYQIFFLALLVACCQSKPQRLSNVDSINLSKDTAELVVTGAIKSITDTSSELEPRPIHIPIDPRPEAPIKKKHRYWKADLIIIKMKKHFKHVREMQIADSIKRVQDTLQIKFDSIFNNWQELRFDTITDHTFPLRLWSPTIGPDTVFLQKRYNNK